MTQRFDEIALFDFEYDSMPVRSRLHYLAPLGLRSGYVESLSSYTARLAHAHDITVASLFGWEIAPQIDRSFLRNTELRSNRSALLAVAFRSIAHAINGPGRTAEDFSRAMEMLTLRHDLKHLTLIRWRNVISTGGLLRTMRAWCPKCFSETSRHQLTYEPLIWSLREVKVCALHNQWLSTECWRCKRTQPILASRTLPGYCSVCGGWLGGNQCLRVINKQDLRREAWVATQVGELLKAGQAIDYNPSKSSVASSIHLCMARSLFRSESALARAVGLPQSSFNEWKHGRALPSIRSLLKIGLANSLNLVDLVLGKIPSNSPPSQQSNLTRQTQKLRKPRNWTPVELGDANTILKALKDRKEYVSLVQAAKLIGRPASSLYFRFWGLCIELTSKRKKLFQTKRCDLSKRILNESSAIITTCTDLNIKTIAQFFGCSETMLKPYRRRLIRNLKNERKKRADSRWAGIKQLLLESMKAEVPPNLGQVAKQAKCSRASLYNKFPRLCRLLALHNQKHRTVESDKRKNELVRAVRKAAFSIYRDNVYPSVRAVARQLSHPKTLRSSPTALQALREVRIELKLNY